MSNLKSVLEQLLVRLDAPLTKLVFKFAPDEWLVNALAKVLPGSFDKVGFINGLQDLANEKGITVTELLSSDETKDYIKFVISILEIDPEEAKEELMDMITAFKQ